VSLRMGITTADVPYAERTDEIGADGAIQSPYFRDAQRSELLTQRANRQRPKFCGEKEDMDKAIAVRKS
jgi:hypothetical protein